MTFPPIRKTGNNARGSPPAPGLGSPPSPQSPPPVGPLRRSAVSAGLANMGPPPQRHRLNPPLAHPPVLGAAIEGAGRAEAHQDALLERWVEEAINNSNESVIGVSIENTDATARAASPDADDWLMVVDALDAPALPVPDAGIADANALGQHVAAQPAQAHDTALANLGYSDKQIEKVKPESKSAIRTHHTALTELGFTHAQICKISNRFQSLKEVADHYPDLLAAMPDLTKEQVVAIASKRWGNCALAALRELAPALAVAPLRLSTEQMVAVARGGGRAALNAVLEHGEELFNDPHKLSSAQIVAIASHEGGRQALEAVKADLPVLGAAPYNLSCAQVVAIASHGGGKQALVAVKSHLPTLVAAPHNLSRERVVDIASNGGKQALETVLARLSARVAAGVAALD